LKSYLREILDVALQVGALFDTLGVRWVVAGSVASSIRGEPRATNDIDLVADLGAEHVAPVVWALEDVYYFDERAFRDAVRRRSSFNLIHLATVLKIDVFVARGDALSQNQLTRRQLLRVGADHPPLIVPILSVEDMILQKLRWRESGGGVSDQQWRDILGLVRVQWSSLDRSYLEAMARQHGLGSALATALRDGSPE